MNELNIKNAQNNLPPINSYIDELLPLISDNYHAESKVCGNTQIITKSGIINNKIFIRCSILPINNY